MEEFIKETKFILIPARHPIKGYEQVYSDAYRVWRMAWEKFYKESKVTEPLNSDSFIIPDELGVLYYQNKCVGLAAYTHGDLRSGTLPDHSWFKAWTKQAYAQLMQISSDCIVCSQFTISPEFAGRGQVVRWKEILFYFNHLRLIHSQSGVMAGHLNVSRGMQNAGGEEFGGIVLNSNQPFNFHGDMQPSQLVAYTRESIAQMVERKNIAPMFNQLWSTMEHASEFPVQSNIIPLKKVA